MVMIKLLELLQKKFTLIFFLLVAPFVLGSFAFIFEHYKVLGALLFFGLLLLHINAFEHCILSNSSNFIFTWPCKFYFSFHRDLALLY